MHGKAAFRRRHRQLLVAAGEHLLAHLSVQRGAQGGGAAVAPDDHLGAHVPARLEARDAQVEVVVDELVVEEEGDAAGLLRPRHQQLVQSAARHGVDVLGLAAPVGEQRERAVQGVRHPPHHGHGLAQHVVVQPDLVQRVQAAGGHGEVDRPSGGDVHLPHVGPSLVDVDLETATGERQGEERAHRARPDDDDVRLHATPRSMRPGAARPRTSCRAGRA